MPDSRAPDRASDRAPDRSSPDRSSPDRGLADRFPALRKLRRARRRAVPFVPQLTDSDCGAACLAMVLGWHGRATGLDEVRRRTGDGRTGADARAVLDAARAFGLRGRGVRADSVDSLAAVDAPVILHWRFRHFVVLERVDANGAVLVDPAIGRRRVGRDELDRAFTGVALLFEPGARFEQRRRRGGLFGGLFGAGGSGGPAGTRHGAPRGLARYLRAVLDDGGTARRAIGMSLLLQLFALALPLATGLIVDRVVPSADVPLLQVLAVGLVALIGFHFLSSLVRGHLLLALRTRVDARLTLELFEHLVSLPFGFFQERRPGDLLMRLNSHRTIREMLTGGVLSAVLDGAMVALYLVLLLALDWRIGLVVAVLGALRVGLFALTRRRQRDLLAEGLQTEARSRSRQVEIVVGIETLKACGVEERAVESWSHLFVDVLDADLARERLGAWVDAALGALQVASPLVVLVYGAVRVLDGDLGLGTMLALQALAIGFLQPLSQLVSTAIQLQLVGSYAERVDEVLDTVPEPVGGQAPGELAGAITLESVSFRYGPKAPLVLRDVSLDIDPGSFVAVVGRSGAGKSTLAQLLVGLRRPVAGRILFDGVDLDDLDVRALRRRLGIVPQSPTLFDGSVRTNIALVEPTAPLERIVEAARQAELHDEIAALPMGYETPIGGDGSTLSGGQRQRLALARALLHQPSVLLLDEATSALDTVTEARIQDRLESLRVTRIVVAHRLSTVRRADRILVLDDGHIAEAGSHDELVDRGGLYADLVAGQLEPTRSRDGVAV